MPKTATITKTQARKIAARYIASLVVNTDLSNFEDTGLTADEAQQVIDAIQERAGLISDVDIIYGSLTEIINDVLK